MFTFLRLQLKYTTGKYAYKVTKQTSNCVENYLGVMYEFGDTHLPIISEKSVDVPIPSGIAVLRGVFSIQIWIFANIMFLMWFYIASA